MCRKNNITNEKKRLHPKDPRGRFTDERKDLSEARALPVRRWRNLMQWGKCVWLKQWNHPMSEQEQQ